MVLAALVARKKQEFARLLGVVHNLVFPSDDAYSLVPADAGAESTDIELLSASAAGPMQIHLLLGLVIQLDGDYNVLGWSKGMANITGREQPQPGLEFSGLGFRGEPDRVLADHEVTRVLRDGCDPRPFPLWLRASGGGLRFVSIVAECVHHEDIWLIFGNEVEANLLSLAYRAPSVASSSKDEEPTTGHEEDEDELFESVSELRSEISAEPIALRRGASRRLRARPRREEYSAEDEHSARLIIHSLLAPDIESAADATSMMSSRITVTPSYASSNTAAEEYLAEEGEHTTISFGFRVAYPSEVMLLRVGQDAALSGTRFRRPRGVTVLELAGEDGSPGGMTVAGVGELPMEGIFAFAAVRGEPHVRVELRLCVGAVPPNPLLGELPRYLLEWRHLVGIDVVDATPGCHRDGPIVGGALEIGACGEVIKWMLDATHNLDLLRCARNAPLPFDRLWFVVRHDSLVEWFPDASKRAELEACGRVINMSEVHLIIKATMDGSAEAYRSTRLAISASPSSSPPPHFEVAFSAIISRRL